MTHILILEENELSSMILSHRLRSHGFSVDITKKESLRTELIEDLPRNSLIILDCYIQELDKHDILLPIKRDKKLESIPIIGFSTTLTQEDFELAQKIGCDEIFKKDIDIDELVSQIHTLINQKRIRNVC